MRQIGYDIDGCVVNSAPWFHMALMQQYGVTDIRALDENGKETFYYLIKGADPEKVSELIEYTIVKYHHAMKEVQGAKYWIRYITCVDGADPIYLTARRDWGGQTDKAFVDWAQANQLPMPYIYKRIEAHEDKPKWVKSMGITHYVEDRYKNAHQIAPHVEKVYMLSTDYNDRPIKADNIQRVFGWKEIADDYLGES